MDTRQTKLPHKQTLLDFLSLYVKLRSAPQGVVKDIAYSIKDGAERILSYFTGVKSVNDRLTEIVSEMEAKIQTAENFDDFYRLIILLRKNAEEAQKLKYLDGHSMLCVTLHAMANIIITTLKKTQPEFKKRTEVLKDQVRQTKETITSYINGPKKGQDVEEKEEELYKYLWELTALGEVEFFREAMRFNVFYASGENKSAEKKRKLSDDFPLPSRLPSTVDVAEFEKKNLKANYAAPLMLQNDFGPWFYDKVFQDGTRIDFDRFVQITISEEEKNRQIKELELKNAEQQNEGNQQPPEDGNNGKPIIPTTPITITPVTPITPVGGTTSDPVPQEDGKKRDGSTENDKNQNSEVHENNGKLKDPIVSVTKVSVFSKPTISDDYLSEYSQENINEVITGNSHRY